MEVYFEKILLPILIILVFLVIALAVLYYNPTIAILGYHGFAKDKASSSYFVIDINEFEEQLKYLKKHNYRTLTLDEFYDYKQNNKKFPHKCVLITMDDGYQSNYDLAFPLLKKYNMNATVFCVGSNIENNSNGYMNLQTLEKLKTEYPNIEIASHSYALHEKGNIFKGKDSLRKDFSKFNKIIQTKYFAYPYGDYNQDAIDILKENNFNLAFSFGPGKKHRKVKHNDSNYEIPRLCISEGMPMWKFALRIILPF